MLDGRPSLRLTGGTVLLRDGLAETAVSISDGWITQTGGTAVDIAGHLVLPGIVDLRSSAWQAMAQGKTHKAVAPAFAQSKGELARHGVTTAWMSVGWMRGDPLARPEIAEAAIDVLSDPDLAGTRTALRIEADTHLTELGDRLCRLIEGGHLVHLGMLPLANLLRDMPASEPGAQAAWIGLRAGNSATRDGLRNEALAKSGSMPRHVCQLAAACDAEGIGFSSLYDRDAEAREYFRMLGARLADAPLNRAAASSAQGMGDPVMIEARDVIGPTKHQSWIGAGLITALVSGDTPSAPLRAALALEAQGLMPLETAWSMISAAPARIAGYRDRGEIAPGKRGDLVVLDRATGHVAATLVGGQLVAGHGPIADALARVAGTSLAAE